MRVYAGETVPAECSVWPNVCEANPTTQLPGWHPASPQAPRAVVLLCCPAGADAADDDRAGKLHTGVFSKDLPWLMYGCGDADKPLKVNGADRRACVRANVVRRHSQRIISMHTSPANATGCAEHKGSVLHAVLPVVTHTVCMSVSCPLPSVQETVDLVEEIAMQYITDTVHTAMRAAAARNAGTTR
jgi:hypothetical protein